MNDNTDSQILDELRKINQYFDKQQKIQKKSWIFVLIFLALFIGSIFFIETYVNKGSSSSTSERGNWTWYQVSDDEEKGNLDEALEKAKYLIKLSPNYNYGYKRLGHLYLTRNELNKAKESFERAYNLFPTESNKNHLDAIINRINNENGS